MSYNIPKKNRHLVHLNSSVKDKIIAKENIMFGELAVNYASGNESLQMKNSANDIVSFDTDIFAFKSGFNEVDTLVGIPTGKERVVVQLTNDNEILSLEDNLSPAFEKYGYLEICIRNDKDVGLGFTLPSSWVCDKGHNYTVTPIMLTFLYITKFGETYVVQTDTARRKDVSYFSWQSKVDYTEYMLSNNKTIQKSSSDPVYIREPFTSLDLMFDQYSIPSNNNLTSLDLRGIYVDDITNINRMFRNCKNLTSIDLRGWNTSKLTNIDGMFEYCNNLETIYGLNEFDTSNVLNTSFMFRFCHKLVSLDLSGWNLDKNTRSSSMLQSCPKLSFITVNNCTDKTITQLINQLNKDNTAGNSNWGLNIDSDGTKTIIPQ